LAAAAPVGQCGVRARGNLCHLRNLRLAHALAREFPVSRYQLRIAESVHSLIRSLGLSIPCSLPLGVLICHTGVMQYNCRLLMQNGDCGDPAGKKTVGDLWLDHHAKIVSPGGNGAEGSIVSCPAAAVATRTDIRLTAHQGHHPLVATERRPECFTSVSTGLLKATPSRC
jgi:hypothetical protein